LLALAIGGCFCNDLRYVATDIGVGVGKIAISVKVELAGDPLLTTAATMAVSCEMLDGSDPQRLIERTRTISMVANSLRRGIPVAVQSSA
jgi:organic hydroperoxide reductase OsmC/OhrA